MARVPTQAISLALLLCRSVLITWVTDWLSIRNRERRRPALLEQRSASLLTGLSPRTHRRCHRSPLQLNCNDLSTAVG
jgi:hypothetical protein